MNKLDNFSQKLHHASNASQIKDANSTRASKYTLVNMTDFDQAYRMTTKKNLNSTAIHDISGYVTKSKRNIVENSKKVKNSSNSILQDLHNEEDDLCLSDDLIYAHAEKRPSTNACFKVDFNHPIPQFQEMFLSLNTMLQIQRGLQVKIETKECLTLNLRFLLRLIYKSQDTARLSTD
jgi:hypothetical protein